MAAYLRDFLSLMPCLRRLVIRLEEPEVEHSDDGHDDVRNTGYLTFGLSNYYMLIQHLLPARDQIET
jgi:hypothetical protein